MAARQRWRELSPRTRRIVLVCATVEGALKAAALRDLVRRPADQVRGPKWAWAALVVLVNSGGGAPLAYLRFGRRQPGTTTR